MQLKGNLGSWLPKSHPVQPMEAQMIGQIRIASSLALALAFVMCATARGLQTQPAEPVAATTGPGEAAPAAEPMRVIVVEVSGTVRVKATPDSDWKPATVDMVVGEQAEFRTGP